METSTSSDEKAPQNSNQGRSNGGNSGSHEHGHGQLERPSYHRFSPQVNTDYLTDELINISFDLVEDFEDYFKGENRWVYDWAKDDYYTMKPLPASWELVEENLILLLMHACMRPKKAWDIFLQYALVKRTESAALQRWQKVRRQLQSRMIVYGTGVVGHRPPRGECIQRAKELCIELILKYESEGVPELGPRPLT